MASVKRVNPPHNVAVQLDLYHAQIMDGDPDPPDREDERCDPDHVRKLHPFNRGMSHG